MVELIELTDEVFASVVDTQSPQGIAAMLIPPTWTLDDALPAAGKPALVMITAGLQDPGNFGTLIRSAEAFGATGILTTAGTVSGWNQKAMRASAGSVFRVPFVGITATDVPALKARGLRLFAAVAESPERLDMISVADADLGKSCALMIGNEGAGLNAEWLQLADARITIPTPGQVESLNAAIAGSLLLYEASRQRLNISNLVAGT